MRRIRNLLRLSWFNAYTWPFFSLAVLAVALWRFIGSFSSGGLESCSYHERFARGPGPFDYRLLEALVYECSSLQWGPIIQMYGPRLLLLSIPFLWLVSSRQNVRLAAVAAGLMGVGIALVPVLVLWPYVGVGQVTFAYPAIASLPFPEARGTAELNGTVSQVFHPGMIHGLALLLAPLPWILMAFLSILLLLWRVVVWVIGVGRR